jgi:hypothetical protein
MKKQLCLIALLAGLSAARAEIVFSDGFTYPDGNLVGAPGSPWLAHDASANLPVQVAGGRARITGPGASAQDINVPFPGGPFASAGTTTALYMGFIAQFTTLPSPAGSYFAHLNTSGFVVGFGLVPPMLQLGLFALA